MWTQFWDMHSGGRQKLKWSQIYIEAEEALAISVFYSRFKRDPNKITCSCCGEDYSISSKITLEELTAYHRSNGKWWLKDIPLEEYIARSQILVIFDSQILPHEKTIGIPFDDK